LRTRDAERVWRRNAGWAWDHYVRKIPWRTIARREFPESDPDEKYREISRDAKAALAVVGAEEQGEALLHDIARKIRAARDDADRIRAAHQRGDESGFT
jgi:ABC-type Fe3+-hydroxamate transport system substrate-binding protein